MSGEACGIEPLNGFGPPGGKYLPACSLEADHAGLHSWNRAATKEIDMGLGIDFDTLNAACRTLSNTAENAARSFATFALEVGKLARIALTFGSLDDFLLWRHRTRELNRAALGRRLRPKRVNGRLLARAAR